MKIQDVINEINRRKKEQRIKPLEEIYQIMRGWQGAYDMETGNIELGSTERAAPTTIWHEFVHKFLFENDSLEAGVMWDNIAKKIECQLFGTIDDLPYAWTLPPKKAKYVAPKHRTLLEQGLAPDIKKENEQPVIQRKIKKWKMYE